MFVLISSWINSLRVLAPASFISLLKETGQIFFSTLKDVIIYFNLFILADLLVFGLAGNKIIEMVQSQADTQVKIVPFVLFLSLVAGIAWFVFNAAFLLLMRRADSVERVYDYFKMAFLRYIQLSLFFSCILFLLLSVLLASGVSKFPTPHWLILCFIRIFELTTLFYWLDSDYSLKQVFISCEKSINFIVYNLSLITIFVAAAWLCELLLKGVVFGWDQAFNLDQVIFGGKAELLLQGLTGPVSVVSFVCFKYGKFFIEFFFMIMLFVVYSRAKSIEYTKSFFEE